MNHKDVQDGIIYDRMDFLWCNLNYYFTIENIYDFKSFHKIIKV